MSASLDKAANLFRTLISMDLPEDAKALAMQGLMCMANQEKFIRKEPPVHSVWSPPAVVEEGVEDEGFVEEEVGLGENVDLVKGEVDDAHEHGEETVRPPHPEAQPQEQDHPMPMLHISPGISMTPLVTTPSDVHDGTGSSLQRGSLLSESQTPTSDWDFILEPVCTDGDSSLFDAPVAKMMRWTPRRVVKCRLMSTLCVENPVPMLAFGMGK